MFSLFSLPVDRNVDLIALLHVHVRILVLNWSAAGGMTIIIAISVHKGESLTDIKSVTVELILWSHPTNWTTILLKTEDIRCGGHCIV